MSEDEEGYRIVDKRYSADSDDGQGGEEPAAEVKEIEQNEEPAAPAEESVQSEQPEAQAVADVFSIAKWVIGIMAATAWQYMGLQVNPATGKVEKDLVQARIAVDTVVFLGDKIHPHLSESERREIRALTSDLQVYFVRQSESPGSEQ